MDSTSQEINPSVLLIILILSIIFFISGLLHLLVRLLLKPSTPSSDDLDTTTALQGQLQQLFHLHDSGVDQSFIDTLPVFVYKAIIGVQDPFDCAVCLCEFEPEDKLRLLPKCSHAFHLECIDTWLLSHSTCPLCRSSLLSDVSGEISGDQVHEEEESAPDEAVPVKLGKFRSGEGSSGDSEKIDERRCFSMGSFEYVMDERLGLRVKIELPAVAAVAAPPPAENSRRRLAVSECGWSSRREEIKGLSLSSNSQRGESFSVSKIWRKLKEEEGRRTGSLGLPPPHPAAAEEDKGGSWRSTGSEFDVESGSCDGGAVSRAGETPSFARRTVQWLVGRQNKVVSHG